MYVDAIVDPYLPYWDVYPGKVVYHYHNYAEL